MTIMIAWSYVSQFLTLATQPDSPLKTSYEEAAIYLQTYKAYENKSPDSIKERIDKDYTSLLRASLTSVKSVNKTDVTTLRTHFGVSHLSIGTTTTRCKADHGRTTVVRKHCKSD